MSEILKEYRIGLLTVCFRKDNFKNFLFNASYNIIGDYDLIIRLCKSNKIGCIQESLAIYRFHDNNLSHKLDISIDEMIQWVKNNKGNFTIGNKVITLPFYGKTFGYFMCHRNFFGLLLNIY